MSQELDSVRAAVPGGVPAPAFGGLSDHGQPVAGPSAQAADILDGASRQAIEAAVEEANRALAKTSLSVRFSIEGETNRIIVRLTDQGTGEVVRQFPSEEQLGIQARLRELMGVLFNEQA